MKNFNTTTQATLNFLFLVLFLMLSTTNVLSQSQTRIAGVGENNSTGRIWNNPGNITADDTNYATAAW